MLLHPFIDMDYCSLSIRKTVDYVLETVLSFQLLVFCPALIFFLWKLYLKPFFRTKIWSFLFSRQRLSDRINSLQTVLESFIASDTYHRILNLEKMVWWYVSFLYQRNMLISNFLMQRVIGWLLNRMRMRMKAVVLSQPSVQAVAAATIWTGSGFVVMCVTVGFMVNVWR